MKKITWIILLLIILSPNKILAKGNIEISPSSIIVEKGSKAVINISAYNTIGDVSILSKDPNIAKPNVNEWKTGMVDENITKKGEIEVNGINTGKASIVFTIDAATFDEEDLSGKTTVVEVIVKEKKIPLPQPETKPDASKKPSNTNSIKSGNNNIKELKVEGYELSKIDNNNYELHLSKTVDEINIIINPEDKKATIKGAGKHQILENENNIELFVISESGIENKIYLKVFKNEVYKIEDLEKVLQTNQNNVEIFVAKNTIISKKQLEMIKNNKKIVNFCIADENNKILYKWIINGNELQELEDINTSIQIMKKIPEKILKITNNNDGIYVLHSKQSKKLFGIRIEIDISNFYDRKNINIYNYIEKENKLINSNKKYDHIISIIPSENNEYLITSKNLEEETISNQKLAKNNVFIIISIIELIIIIILLILYFKNMHKKAIINKNNVKKENNLLNNNLEFNNSQPSNYDLKSTQDIQNDHFFNENMNKQQLNLNINNQNDETINNINPQIKIERDMNNQNNMYNNK